MKKLLTILLLVFICSTISAQKIHWNIRGGIGGSNLLGIHIDDSRYSYQGSVGVFSFKAGVGTDISLAKHWALQPVLYFAAKGNRISASYGSEQMYEGNLHHKLYYLELPLFAAYKLQIAKSVFIHFKAGPYIGYGLSGKASISTPDINDFHETFKENLFTDGCNYNELTYINNEQIHSKPFNRIDAGIATGVELNVTHILFGLEATFGLTPVSDDLIGKKPKNVGIYGTFGYQF